MGEDLFQVVFVLIMLLVAFLQWLFKTIRGEDQEEEERRDWERRMQEGGGEGENSGESDEQEAYRRLMEALGIPEEDQQSPPVARREPEPEPQPQAPPPEPEQSRKQQLEERRRAAGDDRNPYTMPYDPEQDRRRKPGQRSRTPDPTPAPSFAGKAEEMRRQARRRSQEADRELKKIGGGIDADHLEKTEVGTAEIGSEAEADFSWDTPTPTRGSGAYGAVSGVSRAYAIGGRPGATRRISQAELAKSLKDPVSLKKGIILREVLGPPIGLQDKWSNLYHLDY